MSEAELPPAIEPSPPPSELSAPAPPSEAGEPVPVGPSEMVRTYVPLGILWGCLLLSAWVYTGRLAEGMSSVRNTALALLGAPLAGALAYVGLRWSLKKAPDDAARSEGAFLVLIWTFTFLFMVHGAVLALAMRVLASIQQPLALGVGVYLLGLAPMLAGLEHGSPIGIRTAASMARFDAWRLAHRILAGGTLLAGLWSLLAAAFPEPVWLLGVPALALLGLIGGGIGAGLNARPGSDVGKESDHPS